MAKLNRRRFAFISSMVMVIPILFFLNRNENKKLEKEFGNYTLEKEKEFKINSLFPIEIVDYYPPDGLYLGYTTISEGVEITLVNEEGEIIISENMHGDGPEQYTSSLNCLGFSDEGHIWAMTNNQLLQYDQSLELKERMTFIPEFFVTLFNRPEKFSYFFNKKNNSEISFITNPSGINLNHPGSKTDFKEKSLIEIYDTKGSIAYKIAPVPERNIYKDLSDDIGEMYYAIYTIDPNTSMLYLTTSIDNEITIYDLNTNKLIKRIPIDHGRFNSLKSSPITLKSIPRHMDVILASKNHNIYKLDNEMMALEYIQDISIATYEQKKADSPSYHHYRDINQRKLIIFDGINQLSGDIELPNNEALITSLPNNRLLFKIEDPDIEEDSIRYTIYKIVKK